MPMIEWDESFLIGVPQFDEHHKHLVGLLNSIYDDYTTEAPSEKLGEILDELIDYATYHFATEEHWMEEQSYPKLDEHVDEHNGFSLKVVAMQKDYHAGALNISLDALIFLKNWLTDHILKTDIEYGRFIAAKGMSLQMS